MNINTWPALKASGWLSTYLASPGEAALWTQNFDDVHSGGYDTWDHQWTFTCFSNQGLGITPNVNLVSNLGFGAEATHTLVDGPMANRSTRAMAFPLRHPPAVERGKAEDQYVFDHFLDPGRGSNPGMVLRARRKLGRTLRKIGVIQ